MIRVLYVERPHNIGGSVISLYHLVSQLNRTRFEPHVLFYRSHPYRERFQAIGARVSVLNERPSGETATPPAVSPQRDIAASLSRYSRWAAAGYRAAKFGYAFLHNDLPQARRIYRVIKRGAIDLVHVNESLPNGRASVLAARWAGVPVICHFRGFKTLNVFDRRLSRHLTAPVYISNAVAMHHIAQGLPPENGKVIYNAVRLEHFQPHRDGAAIRREFGLRREHVVIGNVGRLDWWKGHDIFLQALARLVQHRPEVRALIVGATDDEPINQAYFENLHRLVAQLGLGKRVIFTGYRDDVAEVMAAMDLIVHSATQPEPFGRVIIEALAAGRPVVATAAGGVPEIIEDGVQGLLVPPGDVGALENAMVALLSDRPRAEALAQAGYQHVCQHFSVQAQAVAIETLYETVLMRGQRQTAGSFNLNPKRETEITS
ncbi:MAG TPA: glycosyltransferase family 4 protein [Anaerolineae bacterium]|nr:glycosyltransferase family 4 protein [Anaerolineae bacterium]